MLCYAYPAPANIPASAAAALMSSCRGKGCTSHLAVGSLIAKKYYYNGLSIVISEF